MLIMYIYIWNIHVIIKYEFSITLFSQIVQIFISTIDNVRTVQFSSGPVGPHLTSTKVYLGSAIIDSR